MLPCSKIYALPCIIFVHIYVGLYDFFGKIDSICYMNIEARYNQNMINTYLCISRAERWLKYDIFIYRISSLLYGSFAKETYNFKYDRHISYLKAANSTSPFGVSIYTADIINMLYIMCMLFPNTMQYMYTFSSNTFCIYTHIDIYSSLRAGGYSE